MSCIIWGNRIALFFGNPKKLPKSLWKFIQMGQVSEDTLTVLLYRPFASRRVINWLTGAFYKCKHCDNFWHSFVKNTGVNISHENRNYSDRDPKNFKTFPKFLKKFRSQITVISRRYHRFFILLLKHHFWKMENFSENSQNFETIPTGFRSA